VSDSLFQMQLYWIGAYKQAGLPMIHRSPIRSPHPICLNIECKERPLMQRKGILAWIGVAAVTVTGSGCSHMEKYTDKLGQVSHGVDSIQTGADEVDQAFRDNPVVTEAAPDQGKKQAKPNPAAEDTQPEE
jgi:hypothetical protein